MTRPVCLPFAAVIIVLMVSPAHAEPVTGLIAFLGSTAFTVGATAITVGQVLNVAVILASLAVQVLAHTAQKGRPPTSAIETRDTADMSITVASEIGDRNMIYGAARSGGYLMQYEGRDGVIWRVQTIQHGKMNGVTEVMYGDRRLALDASGWVTTTPFNQTPPAGRSSNIRIRFVNGDAIQSAFPDLVAALAASGSTPAGWNTDSRADGVAYLVSEFTAPNRDVWRTIFPSGIEAVSVVAEGRLCLDPRDNGTRWTRSPALHLLDHLRHESGAELAASRIDAATFGRIATLQEQAVTTRTGDLIPRYTADINLNLSDELSDRLRVLLDSCDGRLIEGPQGLALTGGFWREPTIWIEGDDILAIRASSRGSPRITTANEFVLTIPYPPNGWRVTEITTWTIPASIALIGRQTTSIFGRAVTHQNQMRRLAKIRAARANPSRRMSLTVDYWTGLKLLAEIDPADGLARPATTVGVRVPGRGINTTFEIVGAPAYDGKLDTFDIDLIAMGPEVYAFDPTTEEGPAPVLLVDTRQQGGLPSLSVSSATVSGTTITTTVASPGRTDLTIEARLRTFGLTIWETPTIVGSVGSLTLSQPGQPAATTREAQYRFTATGGQLGPWSPSITRSIP